ncbi:hypothetical protein HYU07_00035 [Candidatus Woesearchaeota archaeon]|nr:hypothetical protein [Candidatus Woesearchaeota archaeon]
MQRGNKNWEIVKNVIDLEYRKLLHEYNAVLIATTSVIIGLPAFIYNVTKDLLSSLIIAAVIWLILNSKREEVAQKLDLKVNEAKNLKYE